MNRRMILFMADVFPLPGEVVSLPDIVLKNSLPGETLDAGEKFVIFYNHFMNVHHMASEVKVVGRTQNEGAYTDVWLRGEKIVMVRNIHPATGGHPSMCDVCPIKDIGNDMMEEEDRKDVERYAAMCRRFYPLDVSLPEKYGIFDILRIMGLTDMEKFYALGMPSLEDLYVYTINTLRLRMAHDMQTGSMDGPFFLN